MMEYGAIAAQVAAEASIALQPSKKACGGGGHQKAQRGIRRYRNYGGTRHNARTCKKDTEEPSKSKASIISTISFYNGDENSC